MCLGDAHEQAHQLEPVASRGSAQTTLPQAACRFVAAARPSVLCGHLRCKALTHLRFEWALFARCWYRAPARRPMLVLTNKCRDSTLHSVRKMLNRGSDHGERQWRSL